MIYKLSSFMHATEKIQNEPAMRKCHLLLMVLVVVVAVLACAQVAERKTEVINASLAEPRLLWKYDTGG